MLFTRISFFPCPTMRSCTARGRSFARCLEMTGKNSQICAFYLDTCMVILERSVLFMGGEFGQWDEWYHEKSLDWGLLDYSPHQGIQWWVRDLNRFHRSEGALFEEDFSSSGFEWIDFHDADSSLIAFLRKGEHSKRMVLVVANFYAGSQGKLLSGGAQGWILGGGPQQRRRVLWRERLGKLGRCAGRESRLPRENLFPLLDDASFRGCLPEEQRRVEWGRSAVNRSMAV